MRIDLRSLFPSVYDGYDEIDMLSVVESGQIDQLNQSTERLRDNQFIILCDEAGVMVYENRFGIKADKSEDIEFRKQRIINRICTKPPFTLRFLKNKLDEMIGTERWNLYIDYDEYTIIVESSATDQKWFNEISITVNQIKPCNMIFKNTPLLNDGMSIGEEINLYQQRLNYRLGVSFVLNGAPFSNAVDKGVIKMEKVKSIQGPMLERLAESMLSNISKVLLNDTLKIENLRDKRTEGNEAIIEFDVAIESGLREVTNIKVLDANEVVLSSSPVYVPLVEAVSIKHTFVMREV